MTSLTRRVISSRISSRKLHPLLCLTRTSTHSLQHRHPDLQALRPTQQNPPPSHRKQSPLPLRNRRRLERNRQDTAPRLHERTWRSRALPPLQEEQSEPEIPSRS